MVYAILLFTVSPKFIPLYIFFHIFWLFHSESVYLWRSLSFHLNFVAEKVEFTSWYQIPRWQQSFHFWMTVFWEAYVKLRAMYLFANELWNHDSQKKAAGPKVTLKTCCLLGVGGQGPKWVCWPLPTVWKSTFSSGPSYSMETPASESQTQHCLTVPLVRHIFQVSILSFN